MNQDAGLKACPERSRSVSSRLETSFRRRFFQGLHLLAIHFGNCWLPSFAEPQLLLAPTRLPQVNWKGPGFRFGRRALKLAAARDL